MAPIYQGKFTPEQAEGLNKLGFNLEEVRQEESPIVQIADLVRKDWVVIPAGFRGRKKDLEVCPARISYSPVIEEAAKSLGINYQNIAKDFLGREFIGNKDWFESLKLNLALGNKMLTMKEFADYLSILDLGAKGQMNVYDVSGRQIDSNLCTQYLNDIVKVKVKSSWRGEWLDADFKMGADRRMRIKHNHYCENRNPIAQNSPLLHPSTLMKDKSISLENWIADQTNQGLPKKSTQSGNLLYRAPDNNSVAGFAASSSGAYLVCNWYPLYSNRGLGVRAARQRD